MSAADVSDTLRAWLAEAREEGRIKGISECARECHDELMRAFSEAGYERGRRAGERQGAVRALVVVAGLALVAGWLGRRTA